MGSVPEDNREFSIKLSQAEYEAVQDHLKTILSLNRQIAEMTNQIARERRSLDMAWAAAFYRNSCCVDEIPKECPPFIKDNRVTVNIEPDGTARWTEKTDG